MPPPQTLVSLVHGRRNGRQLRVEFELRMHVSDERFDVTLVERGKYLAMELDVLLRHRLSLIRAGESCRTEYQQFCIARLAAARTPSPSHTRAPSVRRRDALVAQT